MPLPMFLGLIGSVIIAAAGSVALVHFAGVPLVWLALAALTLTAVVRHLRWH